MGKEMTFFSPFSFFGALRSRLRRRRRRTHLPKNKNSTRKKTFAGGKTVALGPDEYIFASLSIYLDVINIFLMILQLVAAFQRE